VGPTATSLREALKLVQVRGCRNIDLANVFVSAENGLKGNF
jgi:hypothetical protein